MTELEKQDDWEIENGTRHYHIRVCGQLAGVVPRKTTGDNNRRAIKNVISQIRRVRRELAHV